MAKFILYLIESGLCLSLLYLVYFLFLKKETYFNFNRIYLLGIMITALVIPLLHVTIVVSSFENIEEPFQDVGRLRSYYSDLVTMYEEDDFRNKYIDYEAMVFEEDDYSYANNHSLISETVIADEIKSESKSNISFLHKINFIKIFISIYLIGVFIFFVRLIVLLVYLARVVKQNPGEKHEKYKLVLMKKEVPPFSFFRYIFVTKQATQLNEYEQVLAHERIHVEQMHSLDLIIAHAITVFQWFNPLVWLLQKAIKTTHEYIADSKVVNQGFELFDYQSLLLSQLVSIQSVELVNNFNLISIKKRIEMMTKNKSRFTAKLKALIVIPMVLIAFFLFAHMTVKSPVLNFTNFNTIKISNLDGIWENQDSKDYGTFIKFHDNVLSVLESTKEVVVAELLITLKDKEIIINSFSRTKVTLKYQLSNDQLKIWWNDSKASTYNKTNFANTFEALTPNKHKGINLPTTSHTKLLEKSHYVYNIYVHENKYYVEDVECTLASLESTIRQRVAKFNKLDKPFITARLVVDKNTTMKPLYELRQVLRKLRLYKIAYATFPSEYASALHYHATGIGQILPPTVEDGAEEVEREEVKDILIVIEPTRDVNALSVKFESFVQNHPKYLAAFDWNNNTTYDEYIAITNMTYAVIYKLRDAYSVQKYSMKYTDLPKAMQKEVRKKYPLSISQYNTDED